MAKFRVRARTVDMLGRQQIAGIPTAISELFKNAHDAYARNVEVDYYRDDGLFVLRDDGLGMTREDFEQRWLTLGTESKLSGKGGLRPPPKDKKQALRPVLGEKGIGRLAIAIIGPQVFILTRAKRNGQPGEKTIGAYLHWGLFELPGLDLEDILIPVREFEGSTLPDAEMVREMLDEVSNSLDNLSGNNDLISLRSRGESARPFTRVEEIRRQAENEFREQEQQLQSRLEETEQRIVVLQEKTGGSGLILSPEQTREIEKFREEQVRTRKELRTVQHELQRNIEKLGTQLKFFNIGLVPLLIMLIAIATSIFRSRKHI